MIVALFLFLMAQRVVKMYVNHSFLATKDEIPALGIDNEADTD
jgi:hypothetical protein